MEKSLTREKLAQTLPLTPHFFATKRGITERKAQSKEIIFPCYTQERLETISLSFYIFGILTFLFLVSFFVLASAIAYRVVTASEL